jgi:hypothetical protein
MKSVNQLAILIAAGAAIGLTGVAQAQYVINITGATLFENFLNKPAATNDYWDVDGDGFARRFGTDDSLAPSATGLPAAGSATPGQNEAWWLINYRANGSVTGFQELVDYSSSFVTNADGPGTALSSAATSKAYINRTLYVNNSVGLGPYNAANPGGFPVRSSTTTLLAVQPGSPTDGLRIDMAPVDVPSQWAVRRAGTATVAALPNTAGYGSNPRVALSPTGTPLSGAGTDNLLATLGSRNLNIGAPNANTIFDTQVAFVPIAVMVNQGAGVTQLRQSELAHLFTTGRLPSGENLTAVTREVGSGTRNGFMNSIGIDPSFGVGENVGAVSAVDDFEIVGSAYTPGNKLGSGDLENQMFNTRLGIGYTGAERGLGGSGWLTTGRAEYLAVQMDLEGGTQYIRPSASTVLNNSTANSWRIGGIEQFATLGDPNAAPVAKGGFNLSTPAMRNVEAAAYINNITRSIAAFTSVPGGSDTLFSPGEFLAQSFVLIAGPDFLPSAIDPTSWSANANFNSNVKNYILNNNTIRNIPTTFGTVNSGNGKVPFRKTGVVYSDGVAGGANYISQGGAAVIYGATVASRNRIAGDFNGDGLRNINDTAELVKAFKQRTGGPAWVAPSGTGPIAGAPGTDASIEVLGDFNNDGNFDAKDVRYWADGLALTSGSLDRKAAFTAVDNAFAGNTFGTTLPPSAGGPRSYKAGDSRADIAGAVGTTPGYAPVGNDGVINAADINYVFKQIRTGDVTWSNLAQAVNADLSADINGDLAINREDVTEILQNVLCTRWWDVNLDGVVDETDRAIAQANLGNAGGWSQGDVNGDGLVTAADVALICGADFNGDATIDFFDYLDFVASFSSGACFADFNGDATIDFFDYLDFVAAFSGGC